MSILAEIQRVRKLAETNAEIDRHTKPDSFTDVMSRVMGKEYKPLTHATPYEEVEANWKLPFPLYPFQIESVNELGLLERSALFWEPGVGKTLGSTAMTLLKFTLGIAERAVVIMPPVLLTQWGKFLSQIPGVTVQIYAGTPAKRKGMKLGEALFTLVSAQIFKRDYERFVTTFGPETTVVRDEAHDIKTPSSDNFRKFSQFVADKSVILLTGSPIASPLDGYSYIKIVNPGVYRSFAQYKNIHVGELDFFGQPTSFKNLDVLANNLALNTSRIIKSDVLKDLPEVTYTPIFYTLDTQHQALYRKLAEEQLLAMENRGGKIDATSTQSLYHALGQIICNYDYFADDPSKRSTCFDLIDQVIQELDPDGKLVLFANYRMTNRKLLQYLQKYNAVGAYGEQTVSQNLASVDYFVGNPDCRVFVAQPSSAGVGIDGLQEVCRDALFLEIPSVSQFHQAVGRLHRGGQKNGVHIRIATAEGTLQVRQQKNLLDKDSLVNQVIRNQEDLRSAIYGE